MMSSVNNHEYHIISDDSLRASPNDHQQFFQNYLSSSNYNTPVNKEDPQESTHNNQNKLDIHRSRPMHHSPMQVDKCCPIITNNPMVMKFRNIGKNGLRVPVVAFSAWSSFGHNITEEAADAVVSAAFENGINYFDTGDAFAVGQAEIMLGNVLRKKPWPRSSYIVSTKIFWKNGPTSHAGGGLSRKFIIEAVEASLRRLQIKYIDILIIHKLDPMCPMEEIVRTMSYLINNGIIFYWGTSRFSPMHISEAFSIARQFNCPPPICEQMEYHMFVRDKMELQMLELFHKAGIGCITWSPISLQNDEGIAMISRKQNKVLNNTKYSELIKLCEKLGCDLIQLSLAWCLQNENVNCVLISATTPKELFQKLNAITIYPILTQPVNEEIEVILANNPVLKRQQQKTPSITVDVLTEEQETV